MPIPLAFCALFTKFVLKLLTISCAPILEKALKFFPSGVIIAVSSGQKCNFVGRLP